MMKSKFYKIQRDRTKIKLDINEQIMISVVRIFQKQTYRPDWYKIKLKNQEVYTCKNCEKNEHQK